MAHLNDLGEIEAFIRMAPTSANSPSINDALAALGRIKARLQHDGLNLTPDEYEASALTHIATSPARATVYALLALKSQPLYAAAEIGEIEMPDRPGDKLEATFDSLGLTDQQRVDLTSYAAMLATHGGTREIVEVFAKMCASGAVTNDDLLMLFDRGLTNKTGTNGRIGREQAAQIVEEFATTPEYQNVGLGPIITALRR